MKIVKTVAALAALAMASSAFAEVNLEAYNKLKSDVVVIEKNEDDTTNKFPGIKNVINAEVTSDHVDAMVEGVIQFYDITKQNDYVLQWDGAISDWYVEARVLDDKLTFGFHDNIHPEGSYLPIWDDNVGAGNIGSDGFTLVYRPIEGLRLGLSLPFGSEEEEVNVIKIDGAAEDACPDNLKKTNIRLGAIYDAGIAEFGVAAHDILDSDERSFGAYVYSEGFFGNVEGLNFRAGFAHGEKVIKAADKIAGTNLFNVAFELVDILPVGLTVEAAGNTDDEESGYDIYAGVKVDVGINEKLSLAVSGKVYLDNSDNAEDTGIGAKAALDIAVTEKDKIEVAADLWKAGDEMTVKLPCYWKHTF